MMYQSIERLEKPIKKLTSQLVQTAVFVPSAMFAVIAVALFGAAQILGTSTEALTELFVPEALPLIVAVIVVSVYFIAAALRWRAFPNVSLSEIGLCRRILALAAHLSLRSLFKPLFPQHNLSFALRTCDSAIWEELSQHTDSDDPQLK